MNTIICMGKNYHITIESLIMFMTLLLIPAIIGLPFIIMAIVNKVEQKKYRKYGEKKQNQNGISENEQIEYIKSLQSVKQTAYIPIYQKKKLLTRTEIEFYNKLLMVTKDYDVIVLPQINLASVISKTTKAKYRNELFRNIDFGIFDKEYNVLTLIELNDTTHLKADRKKRDNMVKNICSTAKVPLITFWTNYENETSYIENRIIEYINQKKKAA